MARPVVHAVTVALCVLVQVVMGVAPAGSVLCFGCRGERARPAAVAAEGPGGRAHEGCCCDDEARPERGPARDCRVLVDARAAESGCCLAVRVPSGGPQAEPRPTVDERARIAEPVVAVLLPRPALERPAWRARGDSLIDRERARASLGLLMIRLVV